MKLPRRQFLHLAAGAAALPAVSRIAWAQAYPSRPITMMVPFPPGGLTDVVGRLIAEGMRTALGQTIIIENVGGATGSIGTGRVARAAPDGYTITVGIWNTHVANGITYALQYDVVSDFEPIALLALLLQEKTGTRFNLVPYRGVNPSVQDLIAGQIDMTISNTATAMPHVRAGRVKACAVTTMDRIAIAPEIPSAEEAGFPWLQFSLWAGLFAPKGTPRDIIDKLNAAAVGTTHDPAMREKLVDQGFVIPPRERQTPEALGAYQKAEIAKWWPIIKSAGAKAE